MAQVKKTTETLESAIKMIALGKAVSATDAIHLLCQESDEQCLKDLVCLAQNYANSGDIESSKKVLDRAWAMSGHASDLLNAYVEVQRLTGNTSTIRQAYKLLGIQYGRRGDISAALDFFSRWQYSHVTKQCESRFELDSEIQDAIKQMAEPYKFSPLPRPLIPGERLRVAYLISCTGTSNYANQKTIEYLVKFHNKSNFEVVFFVVDQLQQIESSPKALESIKFITANSYRVDIAPNSIDVAHNLRTLAKSIHDFHPHLLVITTDVTDHKTQFITSLNPAAINLAIRQVSNTMLGKSEVDASIVTSWHPLIDSTLDCSHIPLEVEFPEFDSIKALSRKRIGLPDHAIVFSALVPYTNIRDPEFFGLVEKILQNHSNAWFLAFSIHTEKPISKTPPFDIDVSSRIRFVDWSENNTRMLGAIDIVLDSTSTGHNFTLLNAISLGKPVIGFENDYLRTTEQSDWSPLQELLPAHSELIVPHRDSIQHYQVITKLVHDPEFRRSIGLKCQQHIRQQYGNPARMVRRYEDRYKALLAERYPNIKLTQKSQKERAARIKFTVIMPTYNHEKFLPTALDSLLAQTHPNWELIVVNDGATDKTSDIINSYAKQDTRIRAFHKSNGGTTSALNEALKHINSDWVCWLSSDDWFEPNKLAVHAEEICLRPNVHFFYTNHFLADEATGQHYPAPFNVASTIPPESLQVSRFFHLNYINGITICIRSSILHELGNFNPRYRAAHDFEMWLRICTHYRAFFIDQHLSTTRLHPLQDTQRSVMTGIIDSGVACLDFLNKHSFNEIFPTFDLSNEHHAIVALRETLQHLLNKQGYIVICGFEQPLIARMVEWLSCIAPKNIRRLVYQEIQNVMRNFENNPEIMVMMYRIERQINEANNYAEYTSYDPIALLKNRARTLQVSGDRGSTESFLKYIQRVETDWQSSQFKSNTPSPTVLNEVVIHPPLKILLVLHNFLPRNHGGVETYTYRQAKALIQLGHKVTVAYPISAAEDENTEIVASIFDDIPVLVMRYFSKGSIEEQITHRIAEELFRSLLSAQKYDIVHFQHFLGVPLSFIPIANEAGAKVVATLHDFQTICFRYHLYVPGQSHPCSGPESADKCARCINCTGQEPGLLAGIAMRLRTVPRIFDQYCDLISTPSGYVSDTLVRWGFSPHKLFTVPLGIEIVGVNQIQTRRSEVAFGFAGNIADVKNFSLLVKAFRLVKGPVRLHFFGGGDPHNIQRLIDMIQGDSRITYHGIYTHRDLAKIYSMMDVLVQPSVVETFGLALREAMSARVPVIAARSGALPEAIKHLHDGILFDSGSLENLTFWLQQFVDHPELINSLRQNIITPLSITSDAIAWQARYDSLINQKSELFNKHLARYQIAEKMLKDFQSKEGEEILQALIADHSPLWMPYNDIGVIRYGQGDLKGAKEMLLMATSRESPPGVAHLNLIRVEAGLGNFEAVLEKLGPLLNSPDTAELAQKLAEEIANHSQTLFTN